MFSHAAAIPYLHDLGFKEILQPVSRAENASHLTSFPHHSHNEYTPVNTPPWPHTQKCGYFLYLMLETPHHAHPKHTCNTNMCTFSATRPTTEWKSTAKHRMEKMHGVIHSTGFG